MGGSVFAVECIPFIVSMCGRYGIVDVVRRMCVHYVLVGMHMIKNMGCMIGCMINMCIV